MKDFFVLLRPGPKIVLMFLFMAYLFPLAGNLVFGKYLVSIYRIHPFTWQAAAMIFGPLVTVLCFAARPRVNFRLPDLEALAARLGGWYLRLRPPLLLLALALGVWALVTERTAYRYSSRGLSQQGSALLVLMVAWNAVLNADVFYSLFVRRNEEPRSRGRLLGDWLLGLSLVITANGTASMFQAMLAITHAAWPRGLNYLLFAPRGLRFWTIAGRYAAMGAFIAVLFGVSWIFGEGLKSRRPGEALTVSAGRVTTQVKEMSEPVTPPTPVAKAGTRRPGDSLLAGRESSGVRITTHPSPRPNPPPQSRLTERVLTFCREYSSYIVERFSIYYYTVLFTSDPARDEWYELDEWPLMLPVKTALFRLDFLLGRPLRLEKPEISSMMQLNYWALTADPIPESRQGSSPGVLAAFAYILPLPLALALSAVYLVLLGGLIDLLFLRHTDKPLSIGGAVLALPYLVSLFQSPPDFLLLFDNATFYVALLAAIALANRHQVGKVPAPACA